MKKSVKKMLMLVMIVTMSLLAFAACDNKDESDSKETQPIVTPIHTSYPEEVIKEQAYVDNLDAKQFTLTVCSPAKEQKLISDFCEKFDNAHPEYKIDWIYLEADAKDVYSMISKGAADEIDVFYFDKAELQKFVEANIIMEFPVELKERIVAGIDQKTIEKCVVDDKLYGIPYIADGNGISATEPDAGAGNETSVTESYDGAGNETSATKPYAGVRECNSIGVNSKSEEPMAALLLAEFLTNDYAQEQRYKEGAVSPTSRLIMGLIAAGRYKK